MSALCLRQDAHLVLSLRYSATARFHCRTVQVLTCSLVDGSACAGTTVINAVTIVAASRGDVFILNLQGVILNMSDRYGHFRHGTRGEPFPAWHRTWPV